MRAVQLIAYGDPLEGLKCVDIPEPEAPGSNQVLIGVEFSPLNQSDLLLARGVYGMRPALPTVIGNEGVGRVLALGPGVENVKVGDRVLAPLSSFTWRERMVASANGLFALPLDADPQQLAMLAINPPTAALLLSEYVNLKPGEWVVQNSANSGVGRWVIAFAKTRGLKTVNIVRRSELVAELKAIGGDFVVVDSPDVSKEIKAAVGQAELRLALDGVSGPATGVLATTLSPYGTLVSYAAMSLGPMSISPLEVIFKPLTVRGFWLGHPESAAKNAPAVAQAAEMIASGRVHIPVAATYALSSIKEAVACATRRKDSSGRSRIIQLTSEWVSESARRRTELCPSCVIRRSLNSLRRGNGNRSFRRHRKMKSKVSQEFCDWSEPIEVTQNEINEFADVTSTSQTRESFQRTGPARLPDA